MRLYQEIILFNEAYLEALITAITQAQQTIDMEVYIFEEGVIGKKVVDALCEAATRGVNVRLLVDGVGSITWGALSPQLESAGVKVKVFHPLPWKIMHWKHINFTSNFFLAKILYLLSRMNSRNHRKVCIIDKKTIFAGSANISEHLLRTSNKEDCWRETSVELMDVNCDAVQYAFDHAWGSLSFKERWHSFRMAPDSIFQLNYSWRLRRKLYLSLLRKISQCRQRIWVTNSYFVPDGRLLKLLMRAQKRGVDVRILLPKKSDVLMISLVAPTFYSILLKNGVAVYEYLPCILHAKTLILDDWYVVGSSNLNSRSFKHDLEVNVEIRTQAAKEILEQQFSTDLSQSVQLQMSDINNQPYYKKIIARLILLGKYWL